MSEHGELCESAETCINRKPGCACVDAERAAEIARLRKFLAEIAKGEGPFSRDRLTHANNTIEAMKQLANDALAGKAMEDKP